MSEPASFRVNADVVAAWKETLSTNRSVKGVEEILKEVLSTLLTQDADGAVVLHRHKVFSWSEALRGASVRAGNAGQAQLTDLADDMRSYLTTSPGPVASAPAAPQAAAPAAPFVAPPAAPARGSSYVPPPAVVYSKAAASLATLSPSGSTTANVRLVTERELPGLVSQLLREAATEVIVVAPWNGGLDIIVRDLLALPPHIGLRVLTRRAQVEDEAWHRALTDFQRRKADLVLSPLLHTRCIIVDGQKLLLGAAGAPANLSKEMGILVTDATVANEARINVGRLWQEAKDTR